MKILGIDAASKTGYAIYNSKKKKIITSGIIDLTKKRGESSGILFLKFRIWLTSILNKNKISFVIYEQSHHRGGASTEIGVNLTGRIQEICAERKIEYTTVHTATLKKFATGNGRAEKDDMKKEAEKFINRKVIDDNEADAIHIARYGNYFIKNKGE
jgi:Holliday junction resolvasome RuvABC endonuclease subunit